MVIKITEEVRNAIKLERASFNKLDKQERQENNYCDFCGSGKYILIKTLIDDGEEVYICENCKINLEETNQ